ncbi:camphor resistance protein CrcB [Roseinatronobacter thiooxidans]|uniref:Fluoride-specific ion channel FluC n=1 Tax=Roseinatronobacter thiooxidans TaxID=121821 RepID=A0A2W7QFN8_9RHOB|nr:CrcB family protein [Roseinatronobacter thiooxidans]PZX47358.1 camphor resistance protein CrcB [Roseinatronobacter thiooxidans]
MNITLTDFVVICIAGGLGSMARAGMGAVLTRAMHPAGAVFVINGVGSFLIGSALGVFLATLAPFNAAQAPAGFTYFAIGLLGGFTTVSTFALQVHVLWQQGRVRGALFAAFGSVLMCPLLAWLGLVGVGAVQGGG